jgi:DNA-binding NarL/FixJ family response regulator
MNGEYLSPSRMFTVLVVDDQPPIRKVLQQMLEKDISITVQTAANGDEAFERIKSTTPDLVLLDIVLGVDEEDGMKCLRDLRDTGYEGIICMLTGDPSPDKLFDALITGADDYIVKSPDFNMRAEIKKLLQTGRDGIRRESSSISVDSLAYLRSRGIKDFQLGILRDFIASGFPTEKELSRLTGRSENAIWKQFHLIRDKLGLESNTQLARILTILSGYTRKQQLKREE